MSLYLLPDTTCKELHRLMNGYWWEGNGDKRGIRWMRWERLCVHKGRGGMGFKDLRDFNLALLVKQGWRLLTNPTSLMARILQAKYYPGKSFLESAIGFSPSLIWRSIWEGSELVRARSRLRIGRGYHVKVWQDAWLPCSDSGKVTNPIPAGLEGMLVNDLLLPETQLWDTAKVRQLFNAWDCELILSIPLSISQTEDKWCWLGNQMGIYSVKDGYRALQSNVSSQQVTTSKMWKNVWRIQAMPKIINLLWRALTNSLPTRSKLMQRGVLQSDLCLVCNAAPETTLHAFVTCCNAKEVWAHSGLGMYVWHCASFMEWLENFMAKLSSRNWGALAAVCWELWRNRNKVVWEAKCMSSRVIVTRCLSSHHAWLAINSQEQPSTQVTQSICNWHKPPEGWVSCSVDAGVFQDSGECSMVRRDAMGRFIGGAVVNFPHCKDPEILEILAIREALSWIRSRRLQCVVVESDCQTAVTAINGRHFMDSYYDMLIMNCQSLLTTMANVKVVFIGRTADSAAHTLVRAVGFKPGHHVWGFTARNCIVAILANDLMN